MKLIGITSSSDHRSALATGQSAGCERAAPMDGIEPLSACRTSDCFYLVRYCFRITTRLAPDGGATIFGVRNPVGSFSTTSYRASTDLSLLCLDRKSDTLDNPAINDARREIHIHQLTEEFKCRRTATVTWSLILKVGGMSSSRTRIGRQLICKRKLMRLSSRAKS